MSQNSTIIFVCEHGAAKSIVAAAYFNKFAEEKELSLRAVARGTNPDNELSANAVAGLRKDGLTPTEAIPHKLSIQAVESALRIVSFCELPEEYHKKAVEQWDGISPVSENYDSARDAILERLKHLLKDLY